MNCSSVSYTLLTYHCHSIVAIVHYVNFEVGIIVPSCLLGWCFLESVIFQAVKELWYLLIFEKVEVLVHLLISVVSLLV